MGGTVGRIGSGVLTLGGSEAARALTGPKSGLSQLLQIPGAILTGGVGAGSNIPSVFGGSSTPNVPGPFTLDPNQVAGDTAAINSLGDTQYKQTLDTLTGSDTTPGSLASLMKASLPATAEDYNAGHVLTSSAYPQEVARQEATLAAQYGLPALQQKQSMGQAALGRQFSLEDFINQANVAKTIGATAAPQVSSGKGQTGTALSGVGALAPLVTAFRGFGKAAAPAAAPAAA